jgi:hypothetical protein
LRIGLKATDQMGQLRAEVELTPEHLTQAHRMQSEIDQSYLPEITEQCAAVVRAYPARGGPAVP